MGGGGWEDELKNKTNLSQSLVEVEAELGKMNKIHHRWQCLQYINCSFSKFLILIPPPLYRNCGGRGYFNRYQVKKGINGQICVCHEGNDMVKVVRAKLTGTWEGVGCGVKKNTFFFRNY